MIKLEKKLNKHSKQFLQKILLYIDTTVVNAVNANSEEANNVLAAGILNIKDAIFSEIIKDVCYQDLNDALVENENQNKKKLEKLEENLNQGQNPVKDQKV